MSKGVYRFIVVYYIFFTSFPLYINSRFKRIVSIKKKILKKIKAIFFYRSIIVISIIVTIIIIIIIIVSSLSTNVYEGFNRRVIFLIILVFLDAYGVAIGPRARVNLSFWIVISSYVFFFSRFFYIYMRIKNRSKPHHSRLIIFIKFSTSTSIQSSLREFQPRFRNIEEKQLLF